MSVETVEEDAELRDLVAQALESNGCLANIRAQLRSSLYLALDEDEKISRLEPLMNNDVKNSLLTPEGKIMFSVIREFLEFFNLDFTLAVYKAETDLCKEYHYPGRQRIAEDLALKESDISAPILLQLIKVIRPKSKSIEINLNINGKLENKAFSNDVESSTICSEAVDNNEVYSDNDSINLSNKIPSERKLNSTYDVSSPTVNLEIQKSENSVPIISNSKRSPPGSQVESERKQSEDEETYQDTSSLVDNVDSGNFEDRSVGPEIRENGVAEHISEKSSETTISSESKALDKPKISPPKSDKGKAKGSLSSLSDLPPLPLGKSRVGDILPSLYSKEFKEKSNLRELDKMFDMEDEYEEDFMCNNDLSLKSENPKINLKDNTPSTYETSLGTSHGNKLAKVSNVQSQIADASASYIRLLAGGLENSTVGKNEDTSLREGALGKKK